MSPKGDGKYGQADLGGNSSEWVLDWSQGSYENPCDDCAALAPASERMFRGGSYTHPVRDLRGADRSSREPAIRAYFTGMRCARTP